MYTRFTALCRPTPADRRPGGHRSVGGFTLIEMLVVIVIISLLAGMVFGMIKMAGRYSDRAKTRRTIELLASAVEEFRAEYGKYPPVPLYPKDPPEEGMEQPVTFEYSHRDLIPEGSISGIINNNGRVFTFGLVSFLRPRVEGAAKDSPDAAIKSSQWSDHNEAVAAATQARDRARDLQATKRFKPYTDQVVRSDWRARTAGGYSYTNLTFVVRDAWHQSLKYESRPPYDSYKIWSIGPDGKDNTTDDIIAGKE